jgi:hypothetical protein
VRLDRVFAYILFNRFPGEGTMSAIIAKGTTFWNGLTDRTYRTLLGIFSLACFIVFFIPMQLGTCMGYPYTLRDRILQRLAITTITILEMAGVAWVWIVIPSMLPYVFVSLIAIPLLYAGWVLYTDESDSEDVPTSLEAIRYWVDCQNEGTPWILLTWVWLLETDVPNGHVVPARVIIGEFLVLFALFGLSPIHWGFAAAGIVFIILHMIIGLIVWLVTWHIDNS